MNTYTPEGTRIVTPENREALSSLRALERTMEEGVIAESVALLCDEDLSLHFDLYGIPAVMPREEVQQAEEGEAVKDIAILTRVGKPVCFRIIGFSRRTDGQTEAILSRRAAQAECRSRFISTLLPGDVIPARITHLENFGAFVDIGCGIVSLLSIDCISVSRISHPSDRFSVGDSIYAVIKRIDEEGRIYVTHRELLGTWEENAARFSAGQTVTGTVRSVENYGIFIELLPNLAGLAEPKEGVRPGDTAAVYIKSILPEKMKIKLIVIDSHAAPRERGFEYFVDPARTQHLPRWVYSPAGASKTVETIFDEKNSEKTIEGS